MKEKVISFFRKKTNKDIYENTVINKLDYFGLDAVVLMSDFFDEFDIINSEEFDIYSYFVEELSFIDFLKKSYKKRLIEKKDLTVDHIIKVAEQKKWFP